MNRFWTGLIVGAMATVVVSGTAWAQASPPQTQTPPSAGDAKQQPGTFAQRHPRRAEVLGRANRLNNEIQADKGKLGGHYNQLVKEDQAIKAQEQAEAKANGGYITKGQQRQLNREENRLRRQINRDHRQAETK